MGTKTAYGLHDGVRWEDDLLILEPGQSASYTIEMNLEKPYMSKDWALTAWGENGKVSVVINGKGTTDHWPLIDRDDNLLPLNEREIEGSQSSTDPSRSIEAFSHVYIAEEKD